MSTLYTAQLQKLWSNAQTKPEWATTKFWEYVFKQHVFTSRQWAVASQQPPTDRDDDLRRVDLVVENIDDSTSSFTLLFLEAKRANATVDLIEEVEYQAFTTCCANLYCTGKPAIWAMTCVGTKARLWAYRLNADYITQFWPPGDELSDKSAYVDFSTHGEDIVNALEFIKLNPIPDNSVFSRPPSPRPSSASLPIGWHDQEVAFMTSSTATHEYSGTSSPVAQSQIFSSVYQVHAQSTHQDMVIDANHSFEITVEKLDGHIYTCKRVIDGASVRIPGDAWVESGIQVSGTVYSGFTFKDDSGVQYYSWSLESEKQKGKKLAT